MKGMNTMRPRTSTLSRALPALLAAAVVSIVLGIVGMHALNTHGVTGNTDHTTMASPMTGAHAGMSPDMSAGQATSNPAGLVSDDGNGPSMGSMVMLCFAMLAATAGALLLLLLGVRRMPRVWAHLPTAPTTVNRWVTARYGSGPPPVWEFSVIRC